MSIGLVGHPYLQFISSGQVATSFVGANLETPWLEADPGDPFHVQCYETLSGKAMVSSNWTYFGAEFA
ncbi:hypothetical protein [Croceicoccus naphthovorans]|nr:hypothetical protein [Croceicoccus naphthovorans]MBB3990847.1 hypothetical protein [Croceicoccus naphthovorans]